MRAFRKLFDAWHENRALPCPYCQQRQPSSMYENDPDIEYLEFPSLMENEHAQKLQELLRLVKDPLEAMWERPMVLDAENPELAGEW
jgi:hypothetical protein